MCPRIFPGHDAETAHLTFPHTELVINGPILRQTTGPPELAGSDITDAVARANAGPKLLAQNREPGMAWRCPIRIGLGKAVRS